MHKPSGPYRGLYRRVPLWGCSLPSFTMDINCLRFGRHGIQMQSRQATDTEDSGTYHIASLAYVRDYAGNPYQTSVGVALRQDTVKDEDRTAQSVADIRKRAADDRAYQDAHGLTNPPADSDTSTPE